MSSASATGSAAVTIHADGRAVRATVGESVAAALLNAGIVPFRRSATGDERGPLCGMGTCFECRVTIDGVAHRRSCLVPVAEGMRVSTIVEATREASP